MTRLNENPRIPEGINTTDEHPLKEFMLLFVGVALSLVVLVVILSVMAQQLAPYIPFRWEQKLTQFDGKLDPLLDKLSTGDGREARGKNNEDVKAEQLIEQNQQAQTALQALVERLTASMTTPSDMRFQVHLLNDATPNAFATLGGHIFVTQGLVTAVSSENALAMVLAHEMAHVKFRHPIQAMSRGALLQLVIVAVSGDQGSVALNSVLGQTGLLTILSFNRDMERDSDSEAMAVLMQHYGHLAGADEFFSEVLSRDGDAGWQAAFETHPATQERIDTIVARIKLSQQDEIHAQKLTPMDASLLALTSRVDSK